MLKQLQDKTDEEIAATLTGRKITFSREIAEAEETSHVRSVDEVYNGVDGEKCVRFVSPTGWRFIRLADIIKISRKTY